MSRPYNQFSEKRAADRLAMAREVVSLCRRAAPKSVSSKIIMDYHHNRKRVAVIIEGPCNLATTVTFAGDTPHQRPDTYVLPWYFSGVSRRDAKIALGFAQEINEFHRRKATDVFYGFTELMRTLAVRLEWMEGGRAVNLN